MTIHSLTIAFYLFLMHSFPCATSLSFKFPNISHNHGQIKLANNDSHFSSSEGLHLTPDDDVGSNRTDRAGRAIYFKQLHLWDSRSGKLAGFTTSFTFVIDSNGSPDYGDGLTFFLAENNSVITSGGALGLPVDPNQYIGAPAARYVAVEFDTYGDNNWDPSNIGHHVGIDISSLSSVSYEKWLSSTIPFGLEYEATISYNATSKDLSVVFTGYENSIRMQQGLRYTVDLRKELPERVIFGFSASTGSLFEKNTVKSWTFKSEKLHGDKNMD